MTIEELLNLPKDEQMEYIRHLRTLIEKAVVSLSDSDALDCVTLFKTWEADTWYDMDERLKHGGKLWKVRQGHTSSTLYEPGATGSEALYAEVEKPGQGDTPDNPIHYDNNMELFKGKYYEQGGIVYVCIRSTGTAVYNNLADLVHIYVEAYEG